MPEADVGEREKLKLTVVEHKRKKVRNLIASPEGREALRMEFGLNFVFVDDAEQQKIPVIRLLTPTHSGIPKPQMSQAVQNMMLYSKGQCIVVPDNGISSSCVHWVRNDLVLRMQKTKQHYDYALLCDDDITPPKDALLKLLAWDKDIIAGGCTVRQDPPTPNFRVYYPEEKTYRTAKDWRGLSPDGRLVKDGLVEVGAVGTGFMLIRRQVFDVIGEYYLSCRHERDWFGLRGALLEKVEKQRRADAAKTGNQWWFEFLKHPAGEGEYGEDISFCYKAMRTGLKIFVDTTVRCGHIGWYPYGLDDFCGPLDAECGGELEEVNVNAEEEAEPVSD
jgi:hypothetical protein